MEDYAPSIFLGNWVLVVPYLYYKFRIFDKPILKECISKVEGGPTSYNHAFVQFKIASSYS